MSKITKKVYPVMGMHCAACANNVEKIVKKQEGWKNRKKQNIPIMNNYSERL